jgi:endonuclease-3
LNSLDIPEQLSDILELPGVGPKMAHLLLQHAWNRAEGIGVGITFTAKDMRIHQRELS